MALVVLFFLLITFATHHVSSQNPSCAKCGSLEVPYPLSTCKTCGDPNYRVYCNNNVLEFLSADGLFYKILSINPSAYKLVISPPLIQENSCLSSDVGLGGLRLDDNLPFNISTHNTVMLFNCSDTILLSPLNCTSSSYCRQFEKLELGCNNTLCCHYLKDASIASHRIRVRVGGCTAYTSVVDLKPGSAIETWRYGIELQWVPPS